MGSGASSSSPPMSPDGSLESSPKSLKGSTSHRQSDNKRTKQEGNGEENKSCVVRTNRVAPVIIKNCKEEFQNIVDLKEPIVMGSLAVGMKEHPLLKGKYFLVKDRSTCVDKLNTLKKFQAPNVRQAKGFSVLGMGQPSQDGLLYVICSLLEDRQSDILVFNLREEPVFLVPDGSDMVSYSLRDSDNLQDYVLSGKTPHEAAEQEISLRKMIIDLATVNDENKFYFYNNLEDLSNEPHVLPVQYEDYLLVSEEIYQRPCFNNERIRYQRMCFPADGAPSTEDVDAFISVFREVPEFFLCKDSSNPALIFTCHSGIGRSHVGMVMGCLMLAHMSGFPPETNKKGPSISEMNPNFERGEFMAICQLVQALPNGLLIKNQVDLAVDSCAELLNLRTIIAETKASLEGITDDYIVDGHSAKGYLLDKCCQYLDRYFFLICFNAYLREQFHVMFCSSFTSWLHHHPELIRIRSHLDRTEWKTPVGLISSGVRYLVSDDYIGLDVLSSQMDVQVSNFRKVTGLPVYGMAQPNRNGLCKVVSHLLSKKQGHPVVVLVNLRDDVVVDCDTETFSVRDSTDLEEPVIMHGVTRKDIEEKEEKLKEEIEKKNTLSVYRDISNLPETLQIGSILTSKDMVEQQKLLTPEMLYYRVPMDGEKAPDEQTFDQLMDIMNGLREVHTDEDGPAVVFYCRTGKSRTTTAMALAGLIMCHKKGFPYGAKLGEQERVSCPNAQYTKGDFIVVQKLVHLLPNGHQVKREVDFILDKCFETMTPMHFHMREVIFVTYNKMKKAKTEEERKRLKWRSLDYLERYIYMILFNAYLHAERWTRWKKRFSQWMKQVASKAGVYKILDNLAFYDFSPVPCELKSMAARWSNRRPHAAVRGVFS
ncbi:paladin-like [Liolophura sinensis]|uniref:paladin-like n=1 Tax=Liolophura sinensis TaxID=3198878 RepID=UPI0031581E0F